MADDEAAPMTIKERMAALKLSQVGQQQPGTAPPGYRPANGTVPPSAQRRQPPPPPARPQLPARPIRHQSTNVPPTQDNAPAAIRSIGNLPEQGAIDGNLLQGSNRSARGPLPARISTQSSQVSNGPALPPRRPSGNPSPALPPRRPSEAPSDFDRSRRGSNESMSSIATTRSSVSGTSNAASLTSQGERFKIRAPDFDASKLPPLPPNRTKEEKEVADRKYAGVRPVRPLRQTKSTPRVEQVGQNGTTPPPPVRQPVIQPVVAPRLDDRSEPQAERLAIEPATRRCAEPLPPPLSRADPALPPRPKRSALDWGMNKVTKTPPPLPGVRPEPAQGSDGPPPVPASSKPDLKALQASKPKMNGSAPPTTGHPSSTSGPIDIISAVQFDKCLASSRAVVADFWAPWCGPCRNFAPAYNELTRELSQPGHVMFIKINTDENKDLLQRYEVQAWPTIIIFDQQREVEKILGPNEWPIRAKLDEIAHSAPAPMSTAAVSAPSLYAACNSCLHCRDFSGPDDHAARFPRQAILSTDLDWLAQQLTYPFPSPTDKARAIFTWLHHNVAYDTVAFFGNNVKPSTPQSTLQSGLAVCEGYAGLFAALALKVGLEAVVVSGHGKGFGHTEIKPDDPLPRYNAGHAWNAVKIDDDEWKLIDCCWGAGHLGANQAYNKSFSPDRFTQTNNDFGLDHFPGDNSKQFRTDRRIITWEEYITGNKSGCGADFFSGFVAEEGLAKTSFRPVDKKVVLSQQGPAVRFSFQKVCPHWDPIRCGKGPYYVYLLSLDSLKDAGMGRNFIPFETNGDVWWCDVPLQDFRGMTGQNVQVWVCQKYDGRDGRGVTVEEYKRSRGKIAVGPFAGVCKWVTA
ncbi:hypothetical protein DOTSEDRAFT_41689 [Dothistroma septosporum NZE10]|uniref:Thioredoxin domain-containing protein n=1 Tax=Dothistroma septosporum (strain NZE10 / CBS 128990) TaxID=675120 RepID=N1PW88_DOTSN|nr:hypothetical protein DOTSEDRAFT_41689 [Dothistroma septosporum NZE10]